ncbi:MAG TPA: hypothetical protein DIU39_04820 [Flavobacteriales bacterium]|nr:hypothetical protein [Flavobacteriales bacterium]|tara:strand:+ start:99782 stop:100132 length:351 start_codon:yes stop_codon:yes gene_type:complete
MEALIQYILYNNSALAEFNDAFYHSKMTHYASELIEEFDFSEEEFLQALNKASNTFKTLDIPVQNHIRKIYKIENGISYYDFKLSPLAYALILVNGDTHNPNVAKLQIELINKILD